MKLSVLAGYILALTIVGFFLWVIRGFVRGLRRKAQLPDASDDLPRATAAPEAEKADRVSVDWSFNLFLANDDIEYPGKLESLTPGGAFLRCAAPLRVGRRVTLYVDLPAGEACRVSATVMWVGPGKGRHPAAQVRFEGVPAETRAQLLRAAGMV